MGKAAVNIRGCEIELVHVAGRQSKLDGRVKFDVVAGDYRQEGCVVAVAQPYGSDYRSAPIEVGELQGYEGPAIDKQAFDERVEGYFRKLVSEDESLAGISGSDVSISVGSYIPLQFEVELKG